MKVTKTEMSVQYQINAIKGKVLTIGNLGISAWNMLYTCMPFPRYQNAMSLHCALWIAIVELRLITLHVSYHLYFWD